MGRGETRVSDSKGVRSEKVRKLTMRERRGQQLCFPRLSTKIIFLGDATRERGIVFQKKNFGKQPIENKPYFY